MTSTSETTAQHSSASTTADRPGTRAAHHRFRGEVVSMLRRSGFPSAGISPTSGLLTLTAAHEDDDAAETDWGLIVNAQRDHRVAEHVDAVRASAADAGLRFAASVQRRYGHDTGSAYVVIDLQTLVELLQRVEPWNSTKPSARFRAGLALDGVRWS